MLIVNNTQQPPKNSLWPLLFFIIFFYCHIHYGPLPACQWHIHWPYRYVFDISALGRLLSFLLLINSLLSVGLALLALLQGRWGFRSLLTFVITNRSMDLTITINPIIHPPCSIIRSRYYFSVALWPLILFNRGYLLRLYCPFLMLSHLLHRCFVVPFPVLSVAHLCCPISLFSALSCSYISMADLCLRSLFMVAFVAGCDQGFFPCFLFKSTAHSFSIAN